MEEVEHPHRHLYSTLSPPRSCGERFRDALLRVLDGRLFQFLGLVILFLVVVDGAFFFFLLIGAQRMCRPRTDCEPRNWWYNFAVQFLVALFTWMSVVSMPWRCTNAIHVFGIGCPYRSNGPGKNLYGLDVNDIWFHIPLNKRRWILLFLILNCVTQYFNQVTRIIYYSYDLQNTSPGNIWTNVFFVSSMLCALIAGVWQQCEESALRKAYPDKFEPGFSEYLAQLLCKAKKKDNQLPEEIEAEQEEEETEEDPTRMQSFLVLPVGRSSMRLWAM